MQGSFSRRHNDSVELTGRPADVRRSEPFPGRPQLSSGVSRTEPTPNPSESVISSVIARASAALLAAAGLPLLFASDAILPRLVPGFPATAAWLGQLIAAAWLSVALFNWNSKATILGGIYGRPSVNLNLVLYVVSALALLKVADGALVVRAIAAPFVLMAAVYGAVLLRGPFDRPAAS